VRRSLEVPVMATVMMAALMVRARPAVGWEEGERMRVFLLLNLSKGRRYGVVGAAVRHGDWKNNELHEVKGGEEEWRGKVIWMNLVRKIYFLDWFEFFT
jgi:hypothetical protein